MVPPAAHAQNEPIPLMIFLSSIKVALQFAAAFLHHFSEW
jgi:hypothetical protein